MLSPNVLTTATNVLAQQGMRQAPVPLVEQLINQASADFIRQVGRELHFREALAERVAGHGTRSLFVEKANPVVSLVSIEYVGAYGTSDPADLTQVWIDTSILGRSTLERNQGTWRWTAGYQPGTGVNPVAGTEAKAYLVTYDGGYVTPFQVEVDPGLTRTLPADIEGAVIDLVVSLYLQRGRDKTVTTKTTASGSQAWTDYPPNYLATAAAWTFI